MAGQTVLGSHLAGEAVGVAGRTELAFDEEAGVGACSASVDLQVRIQTAGVASCAFAYDRRRRVATATCLVAGEAACARYRLAVVEAGVAGLRCRLQEGRVAGVAGRSCRAGLAVRYAGQARF